MINSVPHILMQDRLSTGGSFILCDANARGFPIQFASRGFVDLFEYNAAECMGQKCGDLVAGPKIVDRDNISPGMPLVDARQHVQFLTKYAANECRLMMKDPETLHGFAIVLNRKKSGELFVCEVVMMVHRHPTFGWSYCVGLQEDITKDVSIQKLLTAVSGGEYSNLISSRGSIMRDRLTRLGIEGDSAIQYLHDKAVDMWMNVVRGKDENKIMPLSAVSDTTLTASSCGESIEESEDQSSACSRSVRDLPRAGGNNQATGLNGISGVWRGMVSEKLGGYELQLGFRGDGVHVRIDVLGKSLEAQYKVDCSSEPKHFDLHVLPSKDTLDEGIPAPPPIPYIARLEGKVLHLCCPYPTQERPSLFSGPGYSIMTKVADEALLEEDEKDCEDVEGGVAKRVVPLSAPGARMAMLFGAAVVISAFALLRRRKA